MVIRGQVDAAGEIAQVIGREAATALIEHFGGTSLYVPVKVSDDHAICRALGRLNADIVVAWAGGGTLAIPKRGNLHAFYDRVAQARADGKMTIAQIARANDLSERQVYRILRMKRADPA